MFYILNFFSQWSKLPLVHPEAGEKQGPVAPSSLPWPFHVSQHRGKMTQGLFSDVSRGQTTARATSVCLLLPCQLGPLSGTRCPTPITHSVLSCPAVPIKWFISRNLGRAARFWAEEGGMGTILWNKGPAAKGHNSQSQMPLPHTLDVAFIPSFTRSLIQHMFNEDLVLSQTCGIHWRTTEARPPHPVQRSGGRQTRNKLLTGAFR